MAPPIPARRQGLDWSTVSIVLSVAGAGISLVDRGFFLVGVALFLTGLVMGVVGWRSGVRKNRAVIGLILNSANLMVDAGLLISAASR